MNARGRCGYQQESRKRNRLANPAVSIVRACRQTRNRSRRRMINPPELPYSSAGSGKRPASNRADRVEICTERDTRGGKKKNVRG